ncbi:MULTISPECIES: hypothetical protein [unclassified Mesorhizobium]|uniref:hypothetical protein n=1 Tax=unclassified Mesorhizobium TaxID=325217 RepID=UPI00112E6496|nr:MULTISPECIES: hypothetical protein [unclassified Mesorhizobium]TPJ51631.1 hypothetical protein FJ426_20580 [Mesorhizobium sp. B2-6-4]TPN42309.1 hypothetical protein FJ979_01860 [Mesorhizobium sp. B1-1-6]
MQRRSFLKALGLAAVLPASSAIKPAAKPPVLVTADEVAVKQLSGLDLQLGTITAGTLRYPGGELNLNARYLEIFG